jgi:hypothetical protein
MTCRLAAARAALDCARQPSKTGWEIEKTWPRDLRLAVLKAVQEIEAQEGS